jgi:hypothetical protein
MNNKRKVDVRGHKRELPSGKETWVKSHKREIDNPKLSENKKQEIKEEKSKNLIAKTTPKAEVKRIEQEFYNYCKEEGFPISDTPKIDQFLQNCFWKKAEEGSKTYYAFCGRENLLKALKIILEEQNYDFEVEFWDKINDLGLNPNTELEFSYYEGFASDLKELLKDYEEGKYN